MLEVVQFFDVVGGLRVDWGHEFLNERVLCVVCVLVFVDEDVLELVLVECCDFRKCAE